ncbi:hypothetical protein C8A03DRAFT_11268 [Achaetomium macrosporum]|uniref:Protection of telomeres protein 1 n=1 Tax=Achaetomium macrosporum TaxID=79813 RepID=A0AAN7CI77_9PEZI|nr:hypothetical protein C8A03DRAFT_11268 [Achaetomium macrosporum]
MSARGSRKGVPDATPQDPPELPLPAKFTEIRAILDERVPPGRLVNIIGLVKDWQVPIATRGTDYKSTIELGDLSTEDESHGLKFNIFRPEADMPKFGAGDVLVITGVRVQRREADPLSVITHHSTSICVYSASKIPEPPQSAQCALAPRSSRRDSYAPSAEESRYVSYLFHKVDRPEEHEFQERANQSLSVKDKFSLLKDVKEGRFYNLIAQVATEPYSRFDVVTLYVSDYTENAHFYLEQWQGPSEPVGDSYGYTSGDVSMPRKKWVGPYGKMSIQITCYEPHATVIRDEVKAGHWVELRNVQIKYGQDGKYLEGFLREGRNFDPSRVNVNVLEATDPETIDPRLKDAIRRCRDYHKKKKKQIKEIKSAQLAGLKRKASNSPQPDKRQLNAKERRKLLREAQEREGKEKHVNEEVCLELNEQVTCEKHNAPFSTVESILRPVVYETTVDGESIALTMPFTCAKYLARVRVVDFFPRSLEDFACCRKRTEFDVLSDNEDDGGSLSPSSGDDEDSPGSNSVWEWRFALRLEDPDPPNTDANKKRSGPRPRLWAFVDNAEAQCLTGLNATDLRRARETLDQLRKAMSVLWGNLEEIKAQKPSRTNGKGQTVGTAEHRPARRGRKPPLRLEKPPLESDGEDGDGLAAEAISNKPFACCLKQYGVYEKVGKEGGKWVKCFGLFGTKIRS